MKSLVLSAAAVLGAASALPAPQSDPIRILPSWWKFDIIALRGPGCPDFNTTAVYSTRPTYGSNTVDGSEIYYWHFAYPHMKASVGRDASETSTWCETTLKYSELKDREGKELSGDYRLKLHKNGTEVLATYDLEEGVTAKWKFTYYPEDMDEVVDEITVNGPYNTSAYGEIVQSPVRKNSERWALPKCGAGTIKYKTQLKVTAKKQGAKGTVSSEAVEYKGEKGLYGVQQGVSYDWEKCAK
ncbi:uncharacterized protein BDR25DRAFT_232079 [Lindgomyces ingoldianus]|uniref:Uncharacterized protein n=1 Tax=Lindgomyces ingoldianus TaxID=673940 RepID=A0ACB6QN10_9PLEO|nr:uncharacterized protein BDR25DRAFT_232079 [Lindgomyces ingoldianus]KAF2468333.1 hypothetical protein BDR25DRAFT_232079 [Lindgomyces ingoldianus]